MDEMYSIISNATCIHSASLCGVDGTKHPECAVAALADAGWTLRVMAQRDAEEYNPEMAMRTVIFLASLVISFVVGWMVGAP